jgi:hypothetical protein
LSKNDDDAKDEFVYDLLKGRHDAQIERRQELDSKASNLMGYVTIVTGLTITLGTLSLSNMLQLPQLYIPYFIGIGSLLTSVIMALIASRVMDWVVVPDITKLKEEHSDKRYEKITIISQRIGEMWKSVESNHDKNQYKAKWIMYSWCFLVAGLIILVIFLGILVATNPTIEKVGS